MLGLPRKDDNKQVAHLEVKFNRRRPVRYTLVPTLVGSMMIMMPRRESDGGMDELTTIPSSRR